MEKIFVIKYGKNWCTKKQGARRAVGIYQYRELAFLSACQAAKPNQTVVVMNESGSVDFTFEIA